MSRCRIAACAMWVAASAISPVAAQDLSWRLEEGRDPVDRTLTVLAVLENKDRQTMAMKCAIAANGKYSQDVAFVMGPALCFPVAEFDVRMRIDDDPLMEFKAVCMHQTVYLESPARELAWERLPSAREIAFDLTDRGRRHVSHFIVGASPESRQALHATLKRCAAVKFEQRP